MALADYNNQWRNRERINPFGRRFPDLDTDHTLRTTNQVTLTGSLALGVDYADEHQVQATGIFLRNTEDEASLTLGNNSNFPQASACSQLRNYRIRYEERELEVLQFHGQHTLGARDARAAGLRADAVGARGAERRLVLLGRHGHDRHPERGPVLGD